MTLWKKMHRAWCKFTGKHGTLVHEKVDIIKGWHIRRRGPRSWKGHHTKRRKIVRVCAYCDCKVAKERQ